MISAADTFSETNPTRISTPGFGVDKKELIVRFLGHGQSTHNFPSHSASNFSQNPASTPQKQTNKQAKDKNNQTAKRHWNRIKQPFS